MLVCFALADGGSWVSSQNTCYFSGTSCKAGLVAQRELFNDPIFQLQDKLFSGLLPNNRLYYWVPHSRSNISAETCSYYGFDGIGICDWTFCYASYTEIGCKKN